MANKKEQKVGLLKYLTFTKDARCDNGVTSPIGVGRFKYFNALWKRYNGNLMVPNLLFLVSLLPLIAVYVFLAIYGVEKLSYQLFDSTKLHYYMSAVGVGLSESSSLLAAKLNIIKVEELYYAALGVASLFMCFGLAGMTSLCIKFAIGDSFVTKKDSYGNNNPRVIKEFFIGVKKYWWQMLIVCAILGFLIAAVGNSVLFFVSQLWQGKAGAGEYILLIVACIVALLGAMVLLHLIPAVVLYDIPFIQKLKNSCIFALQMFLQNLFILALIAAPILIITLTSGFINVLFIAVLLVFGSPFYGFVTANYGCYISEKILTPVYNAQMSRGNRKSVAKKKK